MEDIEKAIVKILENLEEETKFLSFHKLDHILARRILSYGEAAITPLFKHLQLHQGWWSITLLGKLVDIEIPIEIQGMYSNIRNLYLDYGYKKGYIFEKNRRSNSSVKVDSPQGEKIPGEVASS